jgi:hypothetical protein
VKAILIVAAAAAWLSTSPAWAALGSTPSFNGVRSTPSSASRVMAADNTAAVSWTVSTSTQPNGTVIHEYVDSGGTVFAVSWSGRGAVSLETLLGTHFPEWQKGLESAHAARGGGYGPVAVYQSGLVVESGGHMGSLTGRAWLPQALPQGFSTDQIQ